MSALMHTSDWHKRQRMTIRRALKFLGLPYAKRLQEVEPLLKDHLVFARRNKNEELAKTLSEIKAFLRKAMNRTCNWPECTKAIQSSSRHCKLHEMSARAYRYNPVLLVLLLTGCSSINKPTDRIEQSPAPELQLPPHFITPGRAPTVYEKRTPVGSRRSRAVATTWTALPSWIMHADDNVTGYVVGWGTANGVYTNTVVVPGRANTNTSIPNLAKWQRHYFAVKAQSPSGDSEYSPSVFRTVPATNVVDIQDTILSGSTPNGPWKEFHSYPGIRFYDPVGSDFFRSRLSITNYLAE